MVMLLPSGHVVHDGVLCCHLTGYVSGVMILPSGFVVQIFYSGLRAFKNIVFFIFQNIDMYVSGTEYNFPYLPRT